MVTNYLNSFDEKELELEEQTNLSDSERLMIRQELQSYLNSIVPVDVSDNKATMTILRHFPEISAIFKRGFDTAVAKPPLSIGRIIARVFLALVLIGAGLGALYGIWLLVGPLF